MIQGDFTDFALDAEDLVPPLLWEADGLPIGLACRRWGSICGVAQIVDQGAVNIRVRVSDANHHRVETTIPVDIEAIPEPPLGFRVVPGGYFLVGYQPTPGRDGFLNSLAKMGFGIDAHLAQKNWPAERIHLNTFFMQKFEVTNREYAEFLEHSQKVSPPQHWGSATPPDNVGNHPVVDVSYEEALAYCEWKTQKARAVGHSHLYGLPTHWEWEKAAKGLANTTATSTPLYPWGDHWSQAQLHELGSRQLSTVEVSFYLGVASPFGICDLGGNVSEWVDGGKIDGGRIWKQWRGASWRKAGQRYALNFFTGDEFVAPDIRRDDVGFRCVIRIAPESHPEQALVPLGNDPGGFLNAANGQQHIGAFQMARFAVSNFEYGNIVSTHRYKESEKWLPVTNVTYAEAMRFCALKSQQEHRTFRLPTKWEWQRAYRGIYGNTFPWGKNYNRYYCNSIESRWGGLVPVWALWQGTTPDGIYNLCGNTFEWLADGSAVGGSWCSTCESYGRPPYPPDESAADRAGQVDIGFRYIAY